MARRGGGYPQVNAFENASPSYIQTPPDQGKRPGQVGQRPSMGELHQMNMRGLLWLPRVGPSTAWAYRRLTEGLSTQPDGYTVELDTLGAWLGLSGTGHHAPLMRSLRRLVQFYLALQLDEHTLAVRRRVPPLTLPQLRNLHPTLQRVHLRMVNTTPAPAEAGAPSAAVG